MRLGDELEYRLLFTSFRKARKFKNGIKGKVYVTKVTEELILDTDALL